MMPIPSIRLSEWTTGPGRWWAANEFDPRLCQRMGGTVYALGDGRQADAWVASGPRVQVAEKMLATRFPTAQAAAEAAYRREWELRPHWDAIAHAAVRVTLRVFDGNAYHAFPERWHAPWDATLETGRRVMGGESVAGFLDRWATAPSAWQTAAIAFCREFPHLWLEVNNGWGEYAVRWRTDHVEFLCRVGVGESVYVADADGRTLALIEND